ncbi:MAG: diaminopimelate decarboxylase, partial [Bacteroidota bacterium]|nr:diaminopimelate decarboxylase [Bacteroidota bacterium]
MKLINTPYFKYKESQLYCEEVPVSEIVRKAGSPVYIYSKKYFTERYNEFNAAFAEVNHKIFYAVKSNFNLNVINTFNSLGSCFDVNSGGELYRALKAGVNPGKIILTGVGKSESEIKEGLEKNLLMIKAESEEEIYLINEIAAQMNKVAEVAIRVNPDVDALTHPYISTGLAENKFGVSPKEALRLYKKQDELSNVKFTGIDMHIGSQITQIQPYFDAVTKLSDLFFEVKKSGINLSHFDIGGGMGVKYNDEDVFEITQYADKLIPLFKKIGCEIFFEPGRYFTANAGILVSKIQYVKLNNNKYFYIVDAAFNDLMRPSLYGAYHHIQPVVMKDTEDIKVDVVGPICESGDFLAKKRIISKMERNEYLAILSAGSYGMVMSSNYNARRRAPEIMVDGDSYKVIRSR